MKERNAILRTVLRSLLVIAALAFASCDLLTPGLGEEIDIEKPVVGLESHSNGDYVGGKILMSGFVSDDGAIDSVKLVNGSNSYRASVAEGKWSLELDTTSYRDGELDVDITARDRAGKESSISILLIVDNTPPSVLVTTPTEYGIAPEDPEYNKKIAIKGEAADTTRIDKVYVSLFNSADSSPVFVDQPATGTSSWYYIFDSEDASFGGALNGSYYFFIKAVDSSGNANTFFYHFEDLLAISLNPAETPSVEEINNSDNRNIPIPPSVIAPSTPISSVRKTKAAASRMDININPDSDMPQISIISPSEGGSTSPSDNAFSSPVSLYGTVRDDDLAGINEGTLRLVIVDWNDTTSIIHEVTYNSSNPLFTLEGTQWTYSASLDDGEYGIYLEVDDLSYPVPSHGISNLVPFSVSSFAPVVNVNSPTQGDFVSAGGSVPFSVNATGMPASGKVELDWDSDGVFEFELSPAGIDTWSITLQEGVSAGLGGEVFDILTDGDFSAIIRAGLPGNYGNASIRLIGDTSSPVATIDYPSAGGTVNGTISLRGVADDTEKNGETGYLETVYYHLGAAPSSPLFPADYINLNQTYNWNESLDTTLLADGSYSLSVVVEDAAGNTSAPVSRLFNILQASDNPVFSFSNIDAANDTLAEASGNLLETNARIIGDVTDDDSVDRTSLAVTIYNSDGSVATAGAPVSNLPASNGTQINWSHDISYLTDGIYYAVFSVSDVYGKSSQSGPIYFTIDLAPTTLEISYPMAGSYLSSNFSLSGTASDPNGLLFGDHDGDGGVVTAETEYIGVYDGSSWINVPVAAGMWTHSISVPSDHSADGARTYQVRAVDSTGKTTTKSVSFTIDSVEPVLTVLSPLTGLWTKGYSLSMNGTATDANGVISVQVSTNNSSWNSLTGTVNWNGLLDISTLGEQVGKTLYFRSTDIAGNVATSSILINIDRSVPLLSETAINDSLTAYRTGDYSLSGELTDNLSHSLPTYDHDLDGGSVTAEVEYVEISINSGAPEKVPVNSGIWLYPVTFSGGSFSYELQAADRAGNQSIPLFRTVVADNQSPLIDEISSPSGLESYISGSAYTVSGVASDSGAAGLDSVYWWSGARGAFHPAAVSPYTGWNSAVGTTGWSGALNLSTLGEGDKTLYAFAIDKGGNISPVSSVDFTVDQAAPILEETGLGGASTTSNGDVLLEVTITETNGLVHGDLLNGAPVEDVPYFELLLNSTDWALDASRIEYTGPAMTHLIPASSLVEGGNTLLLRTTDLAGRTSQVVRRDIFFDNTAPVVTFINVDPTSVVNGEVFPVQGTAVDAASTINSVTVAVRGPGESVYGPEQPITGSVYSWVFPLDLKPAGTYYNDDAISIRVTAEDGAGNSTVRELSFRIDQQLDMPTLSLSGLSPFTQFATAMVTADDFILAGVVHDSDGVDFNTFALTVDSSATPVRIIKGANGDGAISWFADLSDKAPGTYGFSVSALDILGNPVSGNQSGMVNSDIPLLGAGAKITGAAEDDDAFDASSLLLLQNGADLSANLTVTGDSAYIPWSYTLPATDNLYYFEINGTDATTAAIPVDWTRYGGESLKTIALKDSGAPQISITSPAQGAYVSGSVLTAGEAFDNLAINSLSIRAVQSDNVTSVELTSDPGVALDTTEGTGEYYYDKTSGKYIWDFALERLPDAYENDSITLVYEARDIAGNSTVKERSVTIDTVDPVIDIQYPSPGALVTGEVTIQGTTIDEKISTVEMKRGLTGSWETLPGTYNWSYTFNSVISSVTSDGTDNGDGTFNYPVAIRATDAAGNQTTVSNYSFNISPDLDKPVVSVTTPADNSILGGSILLIGTATDNEAVRAVYARIDINGDGDFVDSFDLNGINSTNDPFEREGTWYEISDFQSSVWKLQINGEGELYRSNPNITGTPQDFIRIQFMAEDIEGARSVELTRTITLDETFPGISNFRINGGGTDVSGTINLLADITDNEGITAIDISYNGGLNYESVYSGNTVSYSLDINKDSEGAVAAGGLGLVDNSSIVKVRLRVTDTTGYQSFSNLELSVDNIVPTGTYTGKVDDIGTPGGVFDGANSITISGTARDSGVVSSFDRVEVYIAQEGNIITPKTGAISTSTTRNFLDGNGTVIYPANTADFIVIDNTVEQGYVDSDGDGFIEDISYASGETRWATWFNTSNIDNNQAVEVHYVIYDKAGNASHYVEIMLIVGSDLDNDGTVEPSEQIAYPQAFQARRGLLYFELFGGSKTGFNLQVVDNLGNPAIVTTAPATSVTIDTSSIANYPEGDSIFTLRLYEGAELKLTKNISVEIKGGDTTPPVLTMSPLSQSSVVDGHLDQGNNGNGADYDISGTVKFQGTVSDDTMVQDIVLNIAGETPLVLAQWESGLFTARNGAVITSQTLDWKDGHSVSFSYEWDSATITNVTRQDLGVSFEVRDYANPTVSDTQTYDVVPYISSVVRNGFNTNRSKLGFYPLRRGESGITINGYNLRAGGTGDAVRIGSLATTNSSTGGVITSDVPLTAASGELTVVVNGVTAINNLNSNSSSYNRENNPYVEGTELWTDDRYIHVWQSDSEQTGDNRGYFTGSGSPVYPAMTSDNSGILYASWSNYAASDVLYGPNNGGATTLYHSYDPLEHTDISFGTRATVVYNANVYGNGSWDQVGAGGVQIWDSQAPTPNDSYNFWGNPVNSGYRFYNMEELYHNQQLMQFTNQRVKAQGDNIHITYFDTLTKSLKYSYQLSGATSEAENTNWINIDGYYDGDDGTRIVGGSASRTTVMKAGEYSAIDVTPTTNYPVIAYYDIANQKLKLAYASSITPNETQWTVQDVTIDGSYTGKYVSMKIDSSGYIHLAYYKTSTGDLCYIKSDNNPTNGTTAYTFEPEDVLDSIGSVGMWADISLVNGSPVISYLDSSKVNTFDGLKVASIETSFDTNYDGWVTVDDSIWETQILPLAYEVESVRTSIEGDTGTNFWDKAIGYASSDFYRIAYYVPEL